jgi:hypothetical protein
VPRDQVFAPPFDPLIWLVGIWTLWALNVLGGGVSCDGGGSEEAHGAAAARCGIAGHHVRRCRWQRQQQRARGGHELQSEALSGLSTTEGISGCAGPPAVQDSEARALKTSRLSCLFR